MNRQPFEHSTPLLLFDYFRVPSTASDQPLGHDRGDLLEGDARCNWVRSNESGRRLLWPSRDLFDLKFAEVARAACRLRTMELFARVLPDASARDALGTSWTAGEAIHDRSDQHVGSIWSDAEGNVFVPFDPNDVIRSFWQETYAKSELLRSTRLTALSRDAYYHVRPMLTRTARGRLRRLLATAQGRSPFPRWPIEASLHDFYGFMFDLVAQVAGGRTPVIAPWPHGFEWTLVLTHDVEGLSGYRNIHLLQHLERDSGFRSSWNFIPRKYSVDDELVRGLLDDGFEVGVHGVDHDGRDFDSLQTFSERLPVMREFAKRWNAVGFRSPATHRVWEWMPLLGFDYDSSYPDTDPYEPQPGGCCSWLPYFNEELVELPITLPQDYTLFTVLGHRDERLWLEKARFLRDRGGMALLITHPDYMLERQPREAYRKLLDAFRDDATAWRALPRDVSSWWRDRAASHIERNGRDWKIVGPAAEAGRIIDL